ncbi:hypothetical protein ACFWOJ_27105 [Streptomyces sp. NPDC058439]|uniref:hypothetical protein n=1 Tax=Streptomyces sp. NPDC058439 TaxID=3346500 RepID=UPI00364C068D
MHDSVYFFLSGSGGLPLASTDRTPGDQAQAATGPKGPGSGTVQELVAQDTRPTSALPARYAPFFTHAAHARPHASADATASAPHHAAEGPAGRRGPASYDGDVGSATAGHRAALRTNDVDVSGLVPAIPYRL